MYITPHDSRRDHMKRQLCRLIMADSDFNNAYRATQYFRQEVKGDMKHPLFLTFQDSIIITYGRPFTSNDFFGPLPSSWSKFSDLVLKQTHDMLMDARDKRVAHNDRDSWHITIQPKGHKLIGEYGRAADTGFEISHFTFSPESFENIEALCLDLQVRVHAEVRRLLDILFPPTDTPGSQVELVPPRDSKPIIL